MPEVFERIRHFVDRDPAQAWKRQNHIRLTGQLTLRDDYESRHHIGPKAQQALMESLIHHTGFLQDTSNFGDRMQVTEWEADFFSEVMNKLAVDVDTAKQNLSLPSDQRKKILELSDIRPVVVLDLKTQENPYLFLLDELSATKDQKTPLVFVKNYNSEVFQELDPNHFIDQALFQLSENSTATLCIAGTAADSYLLLRTKRKSHIMKQIDRRQLDPDIFQLPPAA